MTDFSLSRQAPLPEAMLAEHIYNMETRGYSVIEGFLDDAACELLRAHYAPILESYKPAGTQRSVDDRYHIHDLLARDIAFARLLEDPRLQQLFAPILGEFWIMYAFTGSSIPPRGSNYGGRVHVDSPRLILGYPTNAGIIWALDEFTEENGGTKLLPGSHHSSRVPDEAMFEKFCVKLTCGKGAAILFNARVFHRAGENRTARWRHALTMNTCRPYMKQRMDWVRFIPESISSQLNAQARRIIGFDARLPTSLEEFFVPEDQRLYKAGQE